MFEVAPEVLTLVVGQFLIPLSSCSIVMRARIGHGIVDKVVRQMWIVRMTIEGELQDAHPRQTKLVAQGLYVGRNHTQIFRKEW
jgi:hypothetical protein